jgi:RNA polymerase sigma factor (TIGR02999 family)
MMVPGKEGQNVTRGLQCRVKVLENPRALWENEPITCPKRWGVGMSDVTRILNAIERGNAKATDELLPLVYEELRLVAAQKLSHEAPGQTLQATALVHEAYIRLVGDEPQNWNSRGHFFAAAAEAMRRILVENARRKGRLKRGGGKGAIALTGLEAPFEACPDDLLTLDEALAKLAEADGEAADLLKLRYFAGLTIKQVADLRNVSERTVLNDLAYARAWLHRAIQKDSGSAEV